ncbi:pyruvoyl-dependent arginine decarboxylase [Halovivax limisalsi]|uniref:pyruvoyl-dependent arginine decarboxylase n=1 Tax=Halovivax limisalsi TaxID=1453760 RepID=UPI001FFD5C4D|nr:pyruvoyl-dependent arginine decarboxylase [Halovivax limisalsi]
MSTIQVVQGSATGPTAMAAYDAALADAGVENYNLVTVSSVIPAGVPVEGVGTAPDLGPAGERLTVVEGRARAAGPTSVSAGLGWVESVDDGPGLFYEAAGEVEPADVERRIREGLAAGSDLRDWNLGEPQVIVERASADAGEYAAAVAVAVYGESEPIV